MTVIRDARRTALVVMYNGTDISASLAESLLDFSYTDAAPGMLDDLQITVEDRRSRWQDEWSPQEGDQLEVEIRTFDWSEAGEIQRLPCGSFDVDTVELQGPPDTVNIKAVSIPFDSVIRQETRTKGWDNISLKAIAQEIASKAGLTLLYSAEDNPTYDRLDQTEQSDLSFLQETAAGEAIALKVTDGQLVLFDEQLYEEQPAALTLTRGEDAVLSYSFHWSTSYAVYQSCEISFTDAKKNQTIKAAYTPPGAPEGGPVLKIVEQVDSYADALRRARKRLREKNKEAGKASMSVVGDPRIASGITIQISGWGRFDGKYLIESTTHQIGGGGYTTDMEIRKVLGW